MLLYLFKITETRKSSLKLKLCIMYTFVKVYLVPEIIFSMKLPKWEIEL